MSVILYCFISTVNTLRRTNTQFLKSFSHFYHFRDDDNIFINAAKVMQYIKKNENFFFYILESTSRYNCFNSGYRRKSNDNWKYW